MLCSGKLYYELLAKKEEMNDEKVALVRLEQMYPLDQEKLLSIYKSRIMSKADVNRDGVIDLDEYALVESELKSIYKERKTANRNL